MAGGMQVASLYASIGADTGDLDKGLKGAKGALEDLADNFDSSSLKIAAAVGVIGSAVVTVARWAYDSANDWADYNIEIEKGAISTGMMVDEYSRLTQAAGDAFVSQNDITKALETATKKGYPMTIESLGQIADGLNAITDPAVKAKTASDIFGQSWTDILPFLRLGSQGIEDATQSVKDNLVATEDSVQKSKELKGATDDLADAGKGFANAAGSTVMPAITDVLNGVTDQITTTQALTSNLSLLKKGVDAGVISQEAYNNAVLASNWSTEAGEVAVQKLIDAHGQELNQLNNVTASADDYFSRQNSVNQAAIDQTAAIDEQAIAYAALAEAEIEAAAAQAELTQQFAEQYNEAVSLSSNFGSIIGLAQSFTVSLEEINVQQKIMNENPPDTQAYKDAEKAVADLQKSMEEAANQMTLDMFQATIAIGGVTKAELGAYMNMAVDMGVISQEGADAAIGAYNNAVETINGYQIEEKTGNVVVDAAAAFAAFDLVEAYAFSDKIVRVMMKQMGSSGIGMQSAGPWDERAIGGPVSARTPYLVGERGPEIFVPESHGHIIPNSQMAGQSSAVTNIYNLSMPTTANPGDVRMAFELMEAWA